MVLHYISVRNWHLHDRYINLINECAEAVIWTDYVAKVPLRNGIQHVQVSSILDEEMGETFFASIHDAIAFCKDTHSGHIFIIDQPPICIDVNADVIHTYINSVDGYNIWAVYDKDYVTSVNSSITAKDLPISILREHEELQYINLVDKVIKHGDSRNDRTNTGTKSLFGQTMRFNLSRTFPLFTTKRVFWRGVIEELLWFIKGSTNAKELSNKNIHIWDGNSSREFLDQRGLHNYDEGELGPVYGFQWRHFGADYINSTTDYTGKGVDQLKNVIETLKTDPFNRRIVLSAWNPGALHKMALPPCHMFCQFTVSSDKKLTCIMYQRSCDLGLGVPFNVASYSALTYMIAQICNLIPGEFIHVMGDAHVYNNHIEPLRNEQLARLPKHFPVLQLDKNITDIDEFTFDSFKLVDYYPHPSVKMTMAI